MNDLLELLFGSPVVISKSDSRFIVKGFASTPAIDVHGDTVTPDEFRWRDWPELLVEHGGQPVGQPLTLHRATIADIGKSDEWGIIDVSTGEQVNTYPKDRIPGLLPGTRGLFATAEVTDAATIEAVKGGALRGFSWRGLCRVISKAAGAAKRIISEIDLREISLVASPANPQAALVLAKSGDLNAIFDSLFPPIQSCGVSVAKSGNGSSDNLNAVFDDSPLLPVFHPQRVEIGKGAELADDSTAEFMELFPLWLQHH